MGREQATTALSSRKNAKSAILVGLKSLGSRSDVKLLQTLGDPECAAIVARLLKGPASQKQLREEFGFDSGSASKRMAELSDAGLVSRARSHAPYELTFRAGTWAIVQAAADLARDMSAARAEADAADARELRMAGMKGGSSGLESDSG